VDLRGKQEQRQQGKAEAFMPKATVCPSQAASPLPTPDEAVVM
jgi:hypothetical protein